MEQETSQKIKELIETLIDATGLEGQVVDIAETDGGALAQIESQEAGYLIGRNGDNLKALQQLARAIVSKKIIDSPRLTIDVNNYQQERLETLKSAAQSLAKEVVRQGSARYLPPMNAYERRVVHSALAEVEGIKTESEGLGEDRRIVIKPIQ